MPIREMLLRLDRATADSRALDRLGLALERVPAAMTKMAFVRGLIRIMIRIVGYKLALPRVKVSSVTATILHMLPDDEAVERCGQQLARQWAAVLNDRGMTRAAYRVRVVNGLIAA